MREFPKAAAYVAVATAAAAEAVELVVDGVPTGEATEPEPGVWPDSGIGTGPMPADMDDIPLLTVVDDTELPLAPWVVWGEAYNELLPSTGPAEKYQT